MFKSIRKTLQELQMLSSVTLNCQVTKIVSVSNVTSLRDCLFNCQNGKNNSPGSIHCFGGRTDGPSLEGIELSQTLGWTAKRNIFSDINISLFNIQRKAEILDCFYFLVLIGEFLSVVPLFLAFLI